MYTFACCNDYNRCSDNESCIHKDDHFYDGCEYRKRLEEGFIFYGKKRNVDKYRECIAADGKDKIVEIKQDDISSILRNPAIEELSIQQDINRSTIKREIIIDNGNATILENNLPYRELLHIEVYGELLEILTTETGTISFDQEGVNIPGPFEH